VPVPTTSTLIPPSALPPIQPQPIAENTLPTTNTFEDFDLIIHNQVGLVFHDKVTAIASSNNQGPFSVLPGHTNFISLITDAVTAYQVDGQIKKFEIGLGVLRCLNNKVEVFAGLHVNKEAEVLAKRLQPNQTNTTKPVV